MTDFRKLRVWKRSHELTLAVYGVSKNFPTFERYGIQSQIRRASVSICANIAEGSSKWTDKDYAKFVQISIGSCSEIDYLLILCKDLKYIDYEKYILFYTEINEIRKMLINLVKKLRA